MVRMGSNLDYGERLEESMVLGNIPKVKLPDEFAVFRSVILVNCP
jgi:hypothetical protein